MFIFSSSEIQIEKVLGRVTWWIWRFTGLCFSLLFIVIIVVFCSKSPYEKMESVESLNNSPTKLYLERIGEGALALQNFVKKTSLPDLSQEVLLLAKNPYANAEGKKGDFLLYLKSSGAKYKAKNGEQIFLSCDSLPGGLAPIYRFSSYKTPLWIKPEFTNKGEALVEVGLFTLSKETGLFQEEKIQIVLEQEPNLKGKRETLPFIEILEKAKVWGQDVVFSRFGDAKYRSLKDKMKLEIFQEGKRIFCFLGKGDLLRFDGNEWIPIESIDGKEDRPVAEVKKITPKSIELEIWDPEAFSLYPVKLDVAPILGTVGKSDNLPHAIQWKNAKQVTCLFGKRKYVLKEGDWLVKTEKNWRRLKRSIDVEAYLCHKINGELFIFEALVKEQGKLMMKGFLVDEMRTQAWPFSSVVTVDPKASKASFRSEKKQALLKKPDDISTTYLFPISNKKTSENDHE
ncbi:MAG: hypothetical protein JSS09_09170 [Verrucomicrobia bacterium]|nr:hypothetical protein [Verrucomicrobiota bacterium]